MLRDVGFLIVCHFIFFDFLKVFKLYFKLYKHTYVVTAAIIMAHVGISVDNIQELVSSFFWVLWNQTRRISLAKKQV